MDTQTFEHTLEALRVYDAEAATRAARWQNLASNTDADAAFAADQQALEAVRLAFYEDTKDRNSLDNCRMLGLRAIRYYATGHPGIGVISIGAVLFGRLTGKLAQDGSPEYVATDHMGDERVKLLEMVHDGKRIPDDLFLIGQIDGGGGPMVPITPDAVNWSGLRSR